MASCLTVNSTSWRFGGSIFKPQKGNGANAESSLVTGTHPPSEFCTALFTTVINSVKPGQTDRQTGQTDGSEDCTAGWTVSGSYRLPADVGYWTGTAAGRLEEPEESGRKRTKSVTSRLLF